MKFKNSELLQRHSAAKHQGVKKHQCEKCDNTFAHPESLRVHRKTCEENKKLNELKNVKCDRCEKTFTKFSYELHSL